MSEKQQASGHDQDNSVVEENQEHSQKETVRDPEAVLQKNREILQEKKRREQELKEAREKLSEFEKKELERKGNFEEALKKEREEREKLQQELEKKDQTYAYTSVTGQIKQMAAQEGCLDPEKLIRLAGEEDLDLVEYDDSYNVDKNSLKFFIDKMKKENEFMFSRKGSSARDRAPGSRRDSYEPEKVDIYKADKRTLSSLYRQLREKDLR